MVPVILLKAFSCPTSIWKKDTEEKFQRKYGCDGNTISSYYHNKYVSRKGFFYKQYVFTECQSNEILLSAMEDVENGDWEGVSQCVGDEEWSPDRCRNQFQTLKTAAKKDDSIRWRDIMKTGNTWIVPFHSFYLCRCTIMNAHLPFTGFT